MLISEYTYESKGGAEPIVILELVFTLGEGTEMMSEVHLYTYARISKDIVTHLLWHYNVDIVNIIFIILAVNLCVDVTYSGEGINFEYFGSVDEQVEVEKRIVRLPKILLQPIVATNLSPKHTQYIILNPDARSEALSFKAI